MHRILIKDSKIIHLSFVLFSIFTLPLSVLLSIDVLFWNEHWIGDQSL
jgi:hypothetical protein